MAKAVYDEERLREEVFFYRTQFLKRMRCVMYRALLGELVREDARFLQAAETEPEKWFEKRLLH